MAKPDRLWQTWGASDPYYAVLSDPRFLSARMGDQARAEFFTSGEQYVARILAQAEQRLGPVRRSRALDYGCGVGRVALALASEFGRVTAADIAPAMLERARQHAQVSGAANIEFVRSADGGNLSGEYDLVHTAMVLQRVPPVAGLRLIRSLVACLSPGGIAILHFTYARNAPVWRRLHCRLRNRFRPYDFIVSLFQGRDPRRASIPVYIHDLGRVVSLLQATGVEDISLERSPHVAGFEATLIYCRRSGGSAVN